MNNYTTLKRSEAILVCRKCGALVGNESRDSHEAWHKMLWAAVRNPKED